MLNSAWLVALGCLLFAAVTGGCDPLVARAAFEGSAQAVGEASRDSAEPVRRTISGHVARRNGALQTPAAHIELELVRDEGVVARLRSNFEGEFTLQQVLPGGIYVLRPVACPSSARTFTIRLERTLVLELVLDERCPP